jgi:hypothetical protein
VSGDNLAHYSNAAMIVKTTVIEQVFLQAPNFAAMKLNTKTKCYVDSFFKIEVGVFVDEF